MDNMINILRMQHNLGSQLVHLDFRDIIPVSALKLFEVAIPTQRLGHGFTVRYVSMDKSLDELNSVLDCLNGQQLQRLTLTLAYSANDESGMTREDLSCFVQEYSQI